jgi:hypothetical protein
VQLPYTNAHWFCLPVEGLNMRQINTFRLYELAKALQPLRSLPKDPNEFNSDCFMPLFHAQWSLDSFLKEEILPLDVSVNAAREVSSHLELVIGKVIRKSNATPTAPVPEAQKLQYWEINQITSLLDRLETVLSAELQKHLTYLVSQISGLSMPLLVNKAEVNLWAETLDSVPDIAKKDFREAGRCLAFEVPTAAGFYALRATEATLRVYFTLVTGQDASKMDWGTCTFELAKSGKANKKVTQVLDQIRDVHRNPLMHPEECLTMREAIGLFDIAKSAINALADEIKTLAPKNDSNDNLLTFKEAVALSEEGVTESPPVLDAAEAVETAAETVKPAS